MRSQKLFEAPGDDLYSKDEHIVRSEEMSAVQRKDFGFISSCSSASKQTYSPVSVILPFHCDF